MSKFDAEYNVAKNLVVEKIQQWVNEQKALKAAETELKLLKLRNSLNQKNRELVQAKQNVLNVQLFHLQMKHLVFWLKNLYLKILVVKQLKTKFVV